MQQYSSLEIRRSLLDFTGFTRNSLMNYNEKKSLNCIVLHCYEIA